jgi:hypothetical protein
VSQPTLEQIFLQMTRHEEEEDEGGEEGEEKEGKDSIV